MCWNPDISINTFLFACLSLVFIFLANTYSKYKIQTFDNPLVYLLFIEIAAIQLVEFFLWRNLHNKPINKLFSRIASYVILSQPFTLIFMINKPLMKKILLLLYGIFIIIHNIFLAPRLNTTVGVNGHLSWDWLNCKPIFLFTGLLFYLVPLLFIDKPVLSFFIIILLFTTLISYFRYNTFGTMWCWVSNFILLYFILEILIIKPFYDYKSLC